MLDLLRGVSAWKHNGNDDSMKPPTHPRPCCSHALQPDAAMSAAKRHAVAFSGGKGELERLLPLGGDALLAVHRGLLRRLKPAKVCLPQQAEKAAANWKVMMSLKPMPLEQPARCSGPEPP